MQFLQDQVCPTGNTDEHKLMQLLLVLREEVIHNDTLSETTKLEIYERFQTKYSKLFTKLDEVNNLNPYKREVLDAISSAKAQQAQESQESQENTKESFIGGMHMPKWWVIPLIMVLWYLCCYNGSGNFVSSLEGIKKLLK